ncbi:uncharacterized protein LOC113306459 [Papaver somniferum]|uniref:uncharacterized protein LOC113306459 n=1 Tax=Papaver somniferum TaxID=3469 RepID=UPI000E70561B|nr:uncharacterized protein LOC113306459 [Papaver somniferum]
MANAKNRRCKITKLEVDRVDVFNQDTIKDELHRYYTGLFISSHSVMPCFDNLSFPKFDTAHNIWLETPFEEVEGFFEKGMVEWRLNVYFVKLVPKKEDSLIAKDFMPISLISSFYMIVSKVLTERLKVVIHNLVSYSQGAFIKEKQILDGILLSNECIDSRMKAWKPGFLCKIDMEKAFNNVNWNSLFLILMKHGFW